MVLKRVCFIGADQVHGSFAGVMAYKCPKLEVYVVDQDEEKIMQWNYPEAPVKCIDMRNIIRSCLKKNLFFTTKIPEAIKEAGLIFVSEDTPVATVGPARGKSINFKPLEDAALLIASHCVSPTIIVEMSEIPIRAAGIIKTVLKANAHPDAKFVIFSNPYFFSEETMTTDLLLPEQIFIGMEDTPESKEALETLIFVYTHWVPKKRIFTSDLTSSELSRLLEKPLQAQKMTNINALAELCEVMNVDVSEVMEVIGMDSRFDIKDVVPSIGFGGPYFRKTLLGVVYICNFLNLPQIAAYWRKVIDMNEHQKKRFANKVIQEFLRIKGMYFTIFGFAFEKNSQYATDSPAITVCSVLLQEDAKLRIYDPAVPKSQILKELMEERKQSEEELKKSVIVARDAYEAVLGTQAILICTNWDEFLDLDYRRILTLMIKPAYIFDGCRMLPHDELMEMGFSVQTIGKNLKRLN